MFCWFNKAGVAIPVDAGVAARAVGAAAKTIGAAASITGAAASATGVATSTTRAVASATVIKGISGLVFSLISFSALFGST